MKTKIAKISLSHGLLHWSLLPGPLEINFAWSLTTEQPVLRARSSQNVHLLTYPVKENINYIVMKII
jgi:hypothetical protein